MPSQQRRPGSRSSRVDYSTAARFEPLETRRLLAGGVPADPLPVDAANFGVKARSHTAGTGVPLVLIHGNNAEDDTANNYYWDGLLSYVDAHPSDFAPFDIWIWVHDTGLPIGFNGAQNTQADLFSRFIYQDLQVGVPGSAYAGKQVTLLAHSQGGLVARSFMNHLKTGTSHLQGEDVSGLVTLGTPHHGSPFAVLDWVAALWAHVAGTTLADELVFNQIKNSVETDRPGSVNLAWDNADAVLQGSLVTRFLLSSYTLTAADANALPAPVPDPTRYYPQALKDQFGTLAQLNAAEAFQNKMITVGAYDSSLADNPDTEAEVMAALTTGDPHQQLAAVTGMMGLISSPQTGSANGSTYFGNDGLVPLQSALYLNLAGNGGNFAARNPSSDVTPNAPLIASTTPAGQRYRIYTDPVRDHLDLLETTYQPYWTTLTSDLRSFIDTTAPTITAFSFQHQLPHRVRVTFSENVGASLAAGDLVIVNNATQASIPASNVSYDAQTNVATFSLATPLPDGNYIATLSAASVEDESGNHLPQDLMLHFFVLGGDANRDRSVNFADLVAVAQNYGTTGNTWAQGDFTGEGSVDFQDLVILAQRYGTTLTPPPPAQPVSAASATRRRTPEKVFAVQPIARPRPALARLSSRL
jgi:hypothetical protein